MRDPPESLPDAPPYVPSSAGEPIGVGRKRRMTTPLVTCLVAVAIVAVLVGIFGVFAAVKFRRFQHATMGAEAKDNVASIARNQVAAFGKTGKLCGAAIAVPAKVKPGGKYQPSSVAGEDFNHGSATDGWPCLQFALSSPITFQYEVRVGGGYKGAARGAPDPGPDGFEITAEADRDGDGKTSLFVQVGRIDASGKSLTLAPLFAVDEDE